ncbi:acyl-CoA thioesterase [Hazenella coriacea]|uniref:Acyl-CoA thioester hydrolase n=1 Tax=Hazenella coriacea TaxID=1179467 RepID=A0A4R3LCB5_9BACL|nr:thioesterase family protein [Hazenella coriacea]TCS95086.1 acyl-CoA thioester hydrolase [Hazenella coriacea]
MSQTWPPKDLAQWFKDFRYFTPIQVRFSDTDLIGHINNVSYITYFEFGRVQYLKDLGLYQLLAEPEPGKKGTIVAASIECHYLRPAYYEQEIQIGARVSRIGNSSFDFQYAVTIPAEKSIAAIGKGAVVYIDPQTGKSQPLPEEAKNIMLSYEENITV